MTRNNLPDKLLIISCSARTLAKSAAKAGIHSVALDFYADADTRAYADRAQIIPQSGIGFDRETLLHHSNTLAPAQEFPLVYGSGLDASPKLIDELGQNREVLGNRGEILQTVRDPKFFFKLLDECKIPYPETQQSKPESPNNWLIKSGCSEGGKRVRFCAHEQVADDEYYQRHVKGDALSVLFLASAGDFRIVGFNTLWHVGVGERPFLFAGAANDGNIGAQQRVNIESYVKRLARSIPLVGLNSLDFMVDKEDCRVLELNCRPSATMALYDNDFTNGILAAHIRACRGDLEEPLPRNAELVKGFHVVFAPFDIHVDGSIVWPEYCVDRPILNSRIAMGSPFCTIEAEASTTEKVKAIIFEREKRLLKLFLSQPLGQSPVL